MATGKLIGSDDTAIDGSVNNSYFVLYRYQSSQTGIASEWRVKCSGSGNLKVAIYSDNDGKPSSRLSFNNTDQTVVAGWNILVIHAVSLSEGIFYWLAFNSSVNIVGYDLTTGPGIAFKAYTYSTFSFPDPCPDIDGVGWTRGTNSIGIIASWGIRVLSPSGVSHSVSYGSPKLYLSIKPLNSVQQIAYGTPKVDIAGIVIVPQGISSIILYGKPTLKYPQTLSPSCIVSLVSYGIPSVGIFGFINPQGALQPVVIGTPTILKYVWHVILNGQYASGTPQVNLAYIIGRDRYGNPVYGTAVNTDEVDLVGERLDFQADPAIPNTAQAADVASAIIAKMRLMGKSGIILIPPNCGQELFDVVQITDNQTNQFGVKFRVVGIRFEYNTGKAIFQHRLILGAP